MGKKTLPQKNHTNFLFNDIVNSLLGVSQIIFKNPTTVYAWPNITTDI